MLRFILIFYIIIAIVMFIITIADFGHIALTPKQVYDNCDCNMLGSFLIWLFVVLLNPFYFIVSFIWWIFHVGR